MPRARSPDGPDSEITAIRADIAEMMKSIGRLEFEINEARAAVAHPARNGTAGGTAGNGHHVAEDVLAGAAKFGEEAAHVAGDTVHAGVAWLDDVLRKSPMPVIVAALGIGFVLGVMGRR